MDLDLGHGGGFGWSIDDWGGGFGGGPVPPNSLVLLRPGAERHYAYDCPGPIEAFDPGEYQLRGRWQDIRSAPITLTVEPEDPEI
jgi:hypothetical protein